MTTARLIELWRGGLCESSHGGHVVIADANGIVEAWGNPGAVIFPRSSPDRLSFYIQTARFADRISLAPAIRPGSARP